MNEKLLLSNTELKIIDEDSFLRVLEIQNNDGFDHSYYLDLERLESLVKRGEIFYGFFVNNNLIGFIGLDIEIRVRLHFLSFHKDFHGKGYATQALSKIIDILKIKGMKQLYAYSESGSPVELFFEKQGFKKVGFYKNRFGDGKDANIFERLI